MHHTLNLELARLHQYPTSVQVYDSRTADLSLHARFFARGINLRILSARISRYLRARLSIVFLRSRIPPLFSGPLDWRGLRFHRVGHRAQH